MNKIPNNTFESPFLIPSEWNKRSPSNFKISPQTKTKSVTQSNKNLIFELSNMHPNSDHIKPANKTSQSSDSNPLSPRKDHIDTQYRKDGKKLKFVKPKPTPIRQDLHNIHIDKTHFSLNDNKLSPLDFESVRELRSILVSYECTFEEDTLLSIYQLITSSHQRLQDFNGKPLILKSDLLVIIHNPKQGVLVKRKKQHKVETYGNAAHLPATHVFLQDGVNANHCLIQDRLLDSLKDVLNSFNFVDFDSYRVLDDIFSYQLVNNQFLDIINAQIVAVWKSEFVYQRSQKSKPDKDGFQDVYTWDNTKDIMSQLNFMSTDDAYTVLKNVDPEAADDQVHEVQMQNEGQYSDGRYNSNEKTDRKRSSVSPDSHEHFRSHTHVSTRPTSYSNSLLNQVEAEFKQINNQNQRNAKVKDKDQITPKSNKKVNSLLIDENLNIFDYQNEHNDINNYNDINKIQDQDNLNQNEIEKNHENPHLNENVIQEDEELKEVIDHIHDTPKKVIQVPEDDEKSESVDIIEELSKKQDSPYFIKSYSTNETDPVRYSAQPIFPIKSTQDKYNYSNRKEKDSKSSDSKGNKLSSSQKDQREQTKPQNIDLLNNELTMARSMSFSPKSTSNSDNKKQPGQFNNKNQHENNWYQDQNEHTQIQSISNDEMMFKFDETDFSNTDYIQDMLKDYDNFKIQTSPNSKTNKSSNKSDKKHSSDNNEFNFKFNSQTAIDQNTTAFSNGLATTKSTNQMHMSKGMGVQTQILETENDGHIDPLQTNLPESSLQNIKIELGTNPFQYQSSQKQDTDPIQNKSRSNKRNDNQEIQDQQVLNTDSNKQLRTTVSANRPSQTKLHSQSKLVYTKQDDQIDSYPRQRVSKPNEEKEVDKFKAYLGTADFQDSNDISDMDENELRDLAVYLKNKQQERDSRLKEFRQLQLDEVSSNSTLVSKIVNLKREFKEQEKVCLQAQLMAQRVKNETSYICSMLSQDQDEHHLNQDIHNLKGLTEKMYKILNQ